MKPTEVMEGGSKPYKVKILSPSKLGGYLGFATLYQHHRVNGYTFKVHVPYAIARQPNHPPTSSHLTNDPASRIIGDDYIFEADRIEVHDDHLEVLSYHWTCPHCGGRGQLVEDDGSDPFEYNEQLTRDIFNIPLTRVQKR